MSQELDHSNFKSEVADNMGMRREGLIGGLAGMLKLESEKD